jgi:hypothetical protein
MKTFLELPKSVQIALIALLGVAILSASLLAVFFIRSRASNTRVQAPQAIDVKQVVSDINKTIILPTDETPSVSAVADPSTLVGQPFFAHAEQGDLVVVYPSIKRAILWRPSVKKIVEVSTVSTTP